MWRLVRACKWVNTRAVKTFGGTPVLNRFWVNCRYTLHDVREASSALGDMHGSWTMPSYLNTNRWLRASSAMAIEVVTELCLRVGRRTED